MRRLEQFAAKKQRAEAAWKAEIRTEVSAGRSLRDVAKAAGVSHEQVRRILKEPTDRCSP